MTNETKLTDAYEIARFIKEAKKTTPVKLYVKGDLNYEAINELMVFGEGKSRILFGEADEINKFLEINKNQVEFYYIENDRRNSAIPMSDYTKFDARIEPGAVIRDRVSIGKNAVIMMGAVINIGAEIGDETMIDMNAVVGARGTIGKRSHIGAGAVIAGVLEPPSKTPICLNSGLSVLNSFFKSFDFLKVSFSDTAPANISLVYDLSFAPLDEYGTMSYLSTILCKLSSLSAFAEDE